MSTETKISFKSMPVEAGTEKGDRLVAPADGVYLIIGDVKDPLTEPGAFFSREELEELSAILWACNDEQLYHGTGAATSETLIKWRKIVDGALRNPPTD